MRSVAPVTENVTGARFVPVLAASEPRRRHWSIPDPATASDTDRASYRAYQDTAAAIDTRIRHLLPVLTSTHG
jgi:hypothetical protein